MNQYIIVQKKDTGSITGYSEFLVNTRKIVSYKDDSIVLFGISVSDACTSDATLVVTSADTST
jgi:hypothetical protein